MKNNLSFIKKGFFFFFLFSFHFNLASAQTTTNSPYSAYGLGDLETKAFAPSIAMGDAKYAVAFPYSINIANPASYGFLPLPTFDAGFTGSFLTVSYGDSTQKIKNAYFKNMVFAVPVSKRWWASSFGMVPYSKAGYNISSSENISGFGKVDYSYTGEGGISRFFFGNTFNILKDTTQQLSVGANISYLFGTINKTRKVMPETAALAYSTKIRNFTTVGDFYFDAGAIFSRKINNSMNISLGSDYEFSKKLKATDITLAESYINTGLEEKVKDTIAYDTVIHTIFIPQKIGIGVTLFYNNKWLFAADYSMQDWRQYNYFGKNAGLAKNEQISFGVQYNYNAKERENFYKMMSYRAGMRYANTHINVQNQQLKEYGITFGIGIPIGEKTKGSFNIAAETGVRGENKNGLVGEKFTNVIFGFSFTPSYYDRWFAKPKID